ncbi:MAG: endonuclease III [Candidatus Brockarchaeota archaeon]|nr:endonuclease III [Candidatus Brockarchaeota archaeon]
MADRRARAAEILVILRRNFRVPRLSSVADDPFKVLIRTIISQSTAERNTRRAYDNLSRSFPITPERLSKANAKKIESSLRVAGLYRSKSKIIKEVSKTIHESYGDSLDFIYSEPTEVARKRLIDLPGVGPKTADIVLLFCAKRPVLPVDTHVDRVSKRLGLVPSNARYEEVRSGLQEAYPPKDYFAVHMLLISLGRAYCRALNPLCQECPVREKCPSSKSPLMRKGPRSFIGREHHGMVGNYRLGPMRPSATVRKRSSQICRTRGRRAPARSPRPRSSGLPPSQAA